VQSVLCIVHGAPVKEEKRGPVKENRTHDFVQESEGLEIPQHISLLGVTQLLEDKSKGHYYLIRVSFLTHSCKCHTPAQPWREWWRAWSRQSSIVRAGRYYLLVDISSRSVKCEAAAFRFGCRTHSLVVLKYIFVSFLNAQFVARIHWVPYGAWGSVGL
jgi:hypothetical protein